MRPVHSGERSQAFRNSCSGVSAVEFALLLPVLFLLFVTAIDVSRAVTAANRASFVAESLAGLVSQADHALSPDEIDGFMALAPLINPDSLRYGRQTGNKNLKALLTVTVSSVAFSKTQASCTVDCTYAGGVVFSRSNGASARPCGGVTAASDGNPATPRTIPTSIFGPDSLVVVDIVAYFKPLFLSQLPLPDSFSRTAYYRPRTQGRIDSTQNCAAYPLA